MINPSPIKAITFDIGNVIVRWDPRFAYEPLFKGRKEELDYFLNNVCNLDWHTKHDQGLAFQDNIQDLQNKFPHYATMIGLYEDEWDNMFGGIIKETVDILYQLHALNYTLFALTNFPVCKFNDFCQKNSFMTLFKDRIVSGEEKVTKPDPRIYEILLSRTDSPAAQILFIDDRSENLIAAQECGMKTLHFTNPAQLKSDLLDMKILSR